MILLDVNLNEWVKEHNLIIKSFKCTCCNDKVRTDKPFYLKRIK